jgi:hypothetical protein
MKLTPPKSITWWPIFVLARPGRARPDAVGDTDEEPLKVRARRLWD